MPVIENRCCFNQVISNLINNRRITAVCCCGELLLSPTSVFFEHEVLHEKYFSRVCAKGEGGTFMALVDLADMPDSVALVATVIFIITLCTLVLTKL